MNVCGVIITSNHKTDGIYLPADDRRHYVAWSALTREDFTADYWQELYRWYAGGGHGHVAAYLAALDLTEFDPKAPPPKTPAFWDIVDANRAPEDAELADVLETLKKRNPATAAVTLSSLAIYARMRSGNGSRTAATAARYRTGWNRQATCRYATNPQQTGCGSSTGSARLSTHPPRCACATESSPPLSCAGRMVCEVSQVSDFLLPSPRALCQEFEVGIHEEGKGKARAFH